MINVDTGEQFSYGPDQIQEGLDRLYEADEIIAHNQVKHDLPLLWKLHKWAPRPGCRRTDTLVVARLIHADQKKLRQEDIRRGWSGKLVGAQSLKAWGLRLGEEKMEYGVDEDGKPIPGAWELHTPAMQTYMDQDVRTNLRLLQFLRPWEYPRTPIVLEHSIAELCFSMEEAGIPFDMDKAVDLYQRLVAKRDELEKELVTTYGQWEEVDRVFTPKRDNKTLGYTAGVEVTKYKTVTFNPGSRRHIERKLREYGWTPDAFTPSGQAELNEPVLLSLVAKFPEAKLIVEYLLVQKRLGQLADGKHGWMRVVDLKGRVHPSYNSNGTNTGRMTHHSPNVSQVPSVLKPYGKEFRALFHAPKGWKLIGCDMSGLELRCLAHYLAYWDNGAYADIVINSDVHWHHVQAYGFVPWGTVLDKENPQHKKWRDWSKRITYATTYGGGDAKVGSIVGGTATQGKRLKRNLLEGIKGFGDFARLISASTQKGYIKGLDGRHMPVRSEHAALNMLLQNAGAVLCKTWMVNAFQELSTTLRHGWEGDFVFCILNHDECQVACREELTGTVSETLVRQARAAGEPYAFRCPLDGEAVVGDNWSATH